jgi:hypothetical protein
LMMAVICFMVYFPVNQIKNVRHGKDWL